MQQHRVAWTGGNRLAGLSQVEAGAGQRMDRQRVSLRPQVQSVRPDLDHAGRRTDIAAAGHDVEVADRPRAEPALDRPLSGEAGLAERRPDLQAASVAGVEVDARPLDQRQDTIVAGQSGEGPVALDQCRALLASIDAGHGIIVTPNHCRLSDPLTLGPLARIIKRDFHAMASWHLFKQTPLQRFVLRRMGAFSVYREGVDRKAIDTAVDILVAGKRPLVLFPEGALSRHNDVLMPMMDGPSFIARTAAKRREKQNAKGGIVVRIVRELRVPVKLIGVGEKIGEVYWGPLVGGAIENWFAYVLALAFLLFRPQGLFGEKIIERV